MGKEGLNDTDDRNDVDATGQLRPRLADETCNETNPEEMHGMKRNKKASRCLVAMNVQVEPEVTCMLLLVRPQREENCEIWSSS